MSVHEFSTQLRSIVSIPWAAYNDQEATAPSMFQFSRQLSWLCVSV